MQETQWIEQRIQEGRRVVDNLLKAKQLACQDLTPAKLPKTQGIYMFSDKRTGEIIRAGRTDDQTIQARVYHDHLMGSQNGNLRAQLVKGGICKDMEQAKQWIRGHFVVQFLEKDDLGVDQRWAEHFMLAVLRPRFCK